MGKLGYRWSWSGMGKNLMVGNMRGGYMKRNEGVKQRKGK